MINAIIETYELKEYDQISENCIKKVVGMVKSMMPVIDFYIIPSDEQRLGMVKVKVFGKLIIILEKELNIDSLPELNKGLKKIEGCSRVFEDEFEVGYKENYKTLILRLKTDEFNIGKFAKGGHVN